MRITGLALTLGGWLLAMSGLFISSSNTGRGLFAVIGIAVSLVGSLYFVNKHYLDRAIWKK